jgi:hypothetical protein
MASLIVGIGDCKVSGNVEDVLVTHALGSCIAILIHDPVAKVAGLLHYMHVCGYGNSLVVPEGLPAGGGAIANGCDGGGWSADAGCRWSLSYRQEEPLCHARDLFECWHHRPQRTDWWRQFANRKDSGCEWAGWPTGAGRVGTGDGRKSK